MFSPVEAFLMLSYTGWCMFSPLEAVLMLSYTGMLYVLSCRGFLDVITGMVYTSYTGMVYVLSCRGFLDVIVHRDGVCSLL